MGQRIFNAFEQAEREGASGPSPWLTFVTAGGGPTRVELAGALSEIAQKTLRDDLRTIRPEFARLILLDQAPRVLSALSERISQKAAEALLRLGVEVRSGIQVTSIDREGVQLHRPDSSEIWLPAKTVP